MKCSAPPKKRPARLTAAEKRLRNIKYVSSATRHESMTLSTTEDTWQRDVSSSLLPALRSVPEGSISDILMGPALVELNKDCKGLTDATSSRRRVMTLRQKQPSNGHGPINMIL